MKMREKLVLAMNSHDTQARVHAAIDDFEYVDGHMDHLHTLHADAIIEALFNTDMREKIAGIIDDCQAFCNEDVMPYYCADKITAAFTGDTHGTI
jgi:hypothetical protein